MRRLPVPVLLLASAAVLAGCSDDESSAPPAGTSSTSVSSAGSAEASPAAVCSSLGDLQTSVSALADVPLREGGVDALRAASTSVQEDAEQVVDDARDRYAERSEQLSADVSALQSALGGAVSSPGQATLQAVGTTIATLSRDVTSFVEDVGSTC